MAHSIKNYTGKWEKFSLERFQTSLRRAGADETSIDTLSAGISQASELRSIEDIYQYAYTYLKVINREVAARYSLKHALRELGPRPEGFESFVAKIFFELGYTTRGDHTLKGNCTTHERLLLVEKDEKRYVVQCEFQNTLGRSTDISSSLSTKALFEDLSVEKDPQVPRLDCDGAWLVTNASFTPPAIEYAACSDISLLGWGYPEGDLRSMIHDNGLYPITCVTGLSKTQKIILIQKNIILCRELLTYKQVLKKIRVPGIFRKNVIEECKILCTPTNS